MPQVPGTLQTPETTRSPAFGDARPATFQDIVDAEAKKHGIDPRLARAVAETESGFNPRAVSPKGARGIMQLMPPTAQRLGVDADDPIANVRGGMMELRRLLDENGGDVVKTLRLYNGSPQAPTTATDPYVQKVLGRLQAGAGTAPGLPQSTGPTLGRPPAGGPPPTLGRAPASPPRRNPTTTNLVSPSAPPQTLAAGAPPPPRESYLRSGIRAVGESIDPRTSTGRRNLAGAAGAGIATVATGGAAPLALAGAGILGAVGGGMVAEAGEQIAGTKPISERAVALAGAEQGFYDAAGQAVVWPVKALGRRLIASSVGKHATEGLAWARQTTIARLEDALDATQRAMEDVKAVAGRAVEKAKSAVHQTITGAPPGPPPLASAVGRQAKAVIEGPATTARDLLGKRVERAAQEGPPVDMRELKASAQTVLEKLRPPAKNFPVVAAKEGAEEGADPVLSGVGTQQILTDPAGRAKYPEAAVAAQAVLATAQGEATEETLKHPAMGVIQRILNAEDSVPFYDAHLWKSELQNALQGTYDQAQKKQLTSITQHLTGQLRAALRGYAPYDQATEAYAKVVPLFTKEYAARFKKLAATNPEALVSMINPKKPTALRMIRDLLVDMPALAERDAGEQGATQAGQTAWDTVRAGYTHDKLLKGGIDKLGDNLDNMDPEFAQVMYGDGKGQAVLTNLRQIVDATNVAEAAAKADVHTAQRALTVARRKTPEEIAFSKSSLAGQKHTVEEVGADIIRATALGTGSVWGGLSIMRLLRGPKSADLIEWAAYSPKNTQRLVRLMTGKSPSALAIADVLRASGILSTADPKAKAGGPPPTGPTEERRPLRRPPDPPPGPRR